MAKLQVCILQDFHAKGMPRLFKFHTKHLASKQTLTPKNNILKTSNKMQLERLAKMDCIRFLLPTRMWG